MKIWSKDIAKLAGVSRSTVSKVINNYPGIPQTTKDKVNKIIKKYNYAPNKSAQILAGKKSNILGLFIVDLYNRNEKNKVITSPYFSNFIAAAVDSAKQNNYHILVSEIANKDEFINIKDFFNTQTISGGIFIGVTEGENEVSELIKSENRIVVLDRKTAYEEGAHNTIFINPDNEKAALLATGHLIEMGHKSIGHLAGDMTKLSAVEKYNGFTKAMKRAGLEINDNFVISAKYDEKTGYKVMKEFLEQNKERPTAFFSANDPMAIGAMKAIKEQGLDIPDDISIVGFDNIEISRYTDPQLTTIDVSIVDMGNIAVNRLTQIIETNSDGNESHVVNSELIERSSVKKMEL